MADKTRVNIKAWAEVTGGGTTYFIDGVEVIGTGGTIPIANLADWTRGDMIVGGPAQWQDLAVGANHAVITTDGTDVAWSTGFLDITAAKTLTVQNSLTLAGTDTKALTLTGALTIAADTSITGGGTLALGGFTGTLPKTGTFPVGTGTAGRIAEWVTDTNTLQAATLIKSGAGVLTLAAAANLTLTVPITAAQTTIITATADGDTDVSTLLKSGADGDLRVDRLGVGVAVIAATGTIALPDAGYIGNGAATARLIFDSSGATDYAYFSGCNLGVGTTTPDGLLHLYAAGLPDDSQMLVQGSGAGGLSAYVPNADTAVIGFNIYRHGGADDISLDAGSNFDILKLSDILRIRYDSGIAVGSAATMNTGLSLNVSGNVGINTITQAGKLTIDQASTTAAIPVLELDQADLSEEFINFIATVGAGYPLDTAALGAYYGKARVQVQGVGYKYLALYD